MASSEDQTELVDDMVNMVVLDEVSILNNLRDRFKQDQIYTNVGAILISVNPYRTIPNLYSKQTLKSFQGPDPKISPHIFKVTEAAYRRMLDYEADQSILISGESGAGKTEACKCILQYLADVSGQSGKIQDQILESNPLMEAFGNAKTVRNNNSSRFGKFIQLKFSRTGQLVGADITKYLLEKSRVVFQAPQERNYHIFYELCAGLTGPMRSTLHIGPADDFKYLNQGKTMTIEGVNDANQFEVTKRAMKTIGITDDKQKEIFQVLAAILHIGNINFEFMKETDSVIIKNEKEVDIAAKLLGIKSSALNFALCHRDISVSGQTFKKPLDLKQAVDSRDALAKGLYERLFDWLVDRINKSISSQDAWHTIGVLDIFGFEFFDNNSLEQLLINYCNEKLQLMYNTHVFQQEQKEYQQEEINCDQVEFVDNQPCIDFFEKNMGIMAILDEECKFPQATDKTFLEKLEVNHKTNPVFGKEMRANSRFLVRHFAGEVMYNVAGFMDKNRDSLRNELSVLVKKSELSFVKLLFGDRPSSMASSPSLGRASTAGSGGAPSVCSQFKSQLNTLMKTLSLTSPHFIRCVKPNVLKLPDIFEEKLVSAQLRYTGVLGTIKIRQAGFPVRFAFAEFVHRYGILLSSKQKFATKREEASALAKALKIGHYQIGKTKIFFKSPKAFDELETQRKKQLGLAAAKIQSLVRGRKQYRKYQKIRKIALAFQTAARTMHARHLLLHLKEERTRRLREEQIQRDKEQKMKEEQMRKEKEQKQREKDEKEKEAREQRAKMEEAAKKMGASKHKFKYKYCTCGKARDDEKENIKPNKAHGVQVLKDLLEHYGASSIGNIYEDGRTVHVELFLYKYEFLNKDHAHKVHAAATAATNSGLVPKKIGPSSSTPPKPPATHNKPLAKPVGPLKSFALKPSSTINANNASAAPTPTPQPLAGRGSTGLGSNILSKMSQFQKPEPEPTVVSPRRTTNISPESSQGGITSPRGGSQIITSTTNTSPRSAVISPRGGSQIITSSSNSNISIISPRISPFSNKSSPSASPTSPLSPNSTTPDFTSDFTAATTPKPISTPIPNPNPIPTSTPAITPTANPTSVLAPAPVPVVAPTPSPAPESVAVPVVVQAPTPPPPPKNVVVLPKAPTRAVIHSPSVAAESSSKEVDEDRVYTFQELRAMMAKKLPNVLISLAATLGDMHVEDNYTDASKMDTWEHFKHKVSPATAPTADLQLLASLTKDRAKPPPQRRGRTKPTKGAKKAEPTPSTSMAPSMARVKSTPAPSTTARPMSIPPSESIIPVVPHIPISSSTSRQRPQSYDPPHNAQADPMRAGGAPLVRPSSYSPSPSVSSPTSPSSSSFSPSQGLISSSSSPTAAAMRPQSFSPTPSHVSQSTSNRPHSQPPARQTAAISLISSKSPRRYLGTSLEPGMAPKNVIGVDPSTLTYLTDSGFKVPNFLVSIKNLILKNKGYEKEGIFRIGGREDTISKLGQDIEDGVTDLVCDDVYSIATYLKRWYSRLPQKLLGALSLTDIDSLYDSPNKTKAMLKAKLNETYYALFWWLMGFMHYIASKEETNKMGPKNLATVLGPILREVGADMADLQRNQRLVSVVQHILEYGVSG